MNVITRSISTLIPPSTSIYGSYIICTAIVDPCILCIMCSVANYRWCIIVHESTSHDGYLIRVSSKGGRGGEVSPSNRWPRLHHVHAMSVGSPVNV